MRLIQALFLTWWLFSGGAGFIAFICAKGFWRDYRRKKAEGVGAPFAFWTAVLFACFALEAAITVVSSPWTTTPAPSVEGLVVAILRRR